MTKITHGMRKTSEYSSWCDIKTRCFNTNHKQYLDYGGRGIKICDRWLNFENFFADMGKKTSAKHSIDRIDNDGDYCPDNCRWATKAEQVNNRRSNRFITIGCVTLNVTQWTKEMSFGRTIIQARLDRGWSELKAVTTPIRVKKPNENIRVSIRDLD